MLTPDQLDKILSITNQINTIGEEIHEYEEFLKDRKNALTIKISELEAALKHEDSKSNDVDGNHVDPSIARQRIVKLLKVNPNTTFTANDIVDGCHITWKHCCNILSSLVKEGIVHRTERGIYMWGPSPSKKTSRKKG